MKQSCITFESEQLGFLMEFDRFSCHKNQPKTEENVTSYAFGGRVMEDIPCLPIKSVASKFEGIVQK